MEFDNKYLSYEEYLDLGGTLEDTPFSLFEYKAEMEINKNTFNRLVNLSEIPKEVKLCVYELIDLISIYSKSTVHTGVSSESTDGYSITYSTDNYEASKTYKQKIKDTIKTYLSEVKLTTGNKEVPVLYRGV